LRSGFVRREKTTGERGERFFVGSIVVVRPLARSIEGEHALGMEN